MSYVRCDRIAEPYWQIIPVEQKAEIIDAIPEGHYVTVLARTGAGDWTVRLLRDVRPNHAILVRALRGKSLAPLIRRLLIDEVAA